MRRFNDSKSWYSYSARQKQRKEVKKQLDSLNKVCLNKKNDNT